MGNREAYVITINLLVIVRQCLSVDWLECHLSKTIGKECGTLEKKKVGTLLKYFAAHRAELHILHSILKCLKSKNNNNSYKIFFGKQVFMGRRVIRLS